MPTPIEIVHHEDRTRVPWKNGAGFTEEIAVDDAWRISVADLGADPTLFSAFAGRARVFTVIGDFGVTFEIDGQPTSIAPLEPFPFDGALTPTCVPDGPTKAFNIMVDDASRAATVQRVDLTEQSVTTDPDAVTAVYVHLGRAGDAGPGDCLLVRHESIEIAGTATVLVAVIREIRHRMPEATAEQAPASH
ncbi:HutD/Ves family protein [Rhodococcoides kyotonense]|uniref:HutD family protein n=1 Tax=Rhodococcoides kyotonense TaxID=398843 RepID=A0A239NED3_9NOCA|nr:HutD family protein [Rhodococcus kyotonensis]SNT52658.1 hypothetical protein SAMN05421642_1362 [Rhodococcus kyotonensis]